MTSAVTKRTEKTEEFKKLFARMQFERDLHSLDERLIRTVKQACKVAALYGKKPEEETPEEDNKITFCLSGVLRGYIDRAEIIKELHVQLFDLEEELRE